MKKIYKWHRTISLIIAIPVVLWAGSGFMHPIMTNFKPVIATQFLKQIPVENEKIKLSLNGALKLNGIDSFHNFRFVHIDTLWFYQVLLKPNVHPIYLSANNGKMLKNGDRIYAQYLAKQFLEGQYQYGKDSLKTEAESTETTQRDCCDEATKCVVMNKKGAQVSSVEPIYSFNEEYGNINRLLPAYKVSFLRDDNIRIYVETAQDRFAYAVDDKRAMFDVVFSFFHTWDWFDFAGNLKYPIMAVLLMMAFLSTILGLVIFFKTRSVKPKGNDYVRARQNHRWVSVIASLFTLLFTFSGAFHALDKLKVDTRNDYFNNQIIATDKVDFNVNVISLAVKNRINNISIVKLHDSIYWQVIINKKPFLEKGYAPSEKKSSKEKWSKDKELPMATVRYLSASSMDSLENGEIVYANYLATHFSENDESTIVSTIPIMKFEGEYGFVNKRLPVWKVEFPSDFHERYYVETSTGKLSLRVDDRDLLEGYSFSFLHKHHFMDFAGKLVRDISTMFWAAMQIVMAFFGLFLYFKFRKRNKERRIK
jgi:hypothetical protein